MDENLEQLFMPWHGQKLYCEPISKAVYYLGRFASYGLTPAKHRVWLWHRNCEGKPCKCRPPAAPTFRSQIFQEKSLDKTLADLKDCLVLSTTPSYFSQFQNACLLKSRGFQLLEGRCYRHPGYPESSKYAVEHPGIPDRYQHWEHIWWKVIGKPKEIGLPEKTNQLNNCGVFSYNGLEQIETWSRGEFRNYLAVGWLPRGTPFPKGWKRFYSAADYKLGVNFDLISAKSKVQECPHNFDLSIFENWEPDFEKWSPS